MNRDRASTDFLNLAEKSLANANENAASIAEMIALRNKNIEVKQSIFQRNNDFIASEITSFRNKSDLEMQALEVVIERLKRRAEIKVKKQSHIKMRDKSGFAKINRAMDFDEKKLVNDNFLQPNCHNFVVNQQKDIYGTKPAGFLYSNKNETSKEARKIRSTTPDLEITERNSPEVQLMGEWGRQGFSEDDKRNNRSPRSRSPRSPSPRWRHKSPARRSPRNRSPRNRSPRNRSPRNRSPRNRSPRSPSPRQRDRNPRCQDLSPQRYRSPPRSNRHDTSQWGYGVNKNLKYTTPMTFRFISPISQAKYIRDCSHNIFKENSKNYSIKDLGEEHLMSFEAIRPGQIIAVLQNIMQDFELISKRSKKPSKKLAYKLNRDESTRKLCMDLEAVEITGSSLKILVVLNEFSLCPKTLLHQRAIDHVFQAHKRLEIPKQEELLFATNHRNIPGTDESFLTITGQRVNLCKSLQWLFKELFDPERPSGLFFDRNMRIFTGIGYDGKTKSSGILTGLEDISYEEIMDESDSDDED